MIRWLLIAFLWPMAAIAQDVWQVERDLAAIGLDSGVVDGVADNQTRLAVTDFQYNLELLATGVLSIQEAQFLKRFARISQVQHPFVLDELVLPGGDNANRIFQRSGRVAYANGLHFLAEHSHAPYNQVNKSVRGASITSLNDNASARARRHRARAYDLATATQSEIGLTLLFLSENDVVVDQVPRTQAAYLNILEWAEREPTEPAYARLAIETAFGRIGRGKLCEKGHGEIFFPLVQRTRKLRAQLAAKPESQRETLKIALVCAPAAQKDGLFGELLMIANQIGDEAITDTLLDWGKDAQGRGADDTARRIYRAATERLLAGLTGSDDVQSQLSVGLMPPEHIIAMHALGMAIETRKFGATHIARIESIPATAVDDSFVAASNYHHGMLEAALMFMETRQFDHLRRLGVYMAAQKGTVRPERLHNTVYTDKVWDVAIFGLQRLKEAEELQRLHDLANLVLPTLLEQGAILQSLEVALMQTEAALEIGAFEDAEPALVRAVSIAQSNGLMANVEKRVGNIRRLLNLSRLTDLPATERLIRQLDIHYSEFCNPNSSADINTWEFPYIDFEAIGDDPEMPAALARADVLNRILTCGITRKTSGQESRLICALAGFAGRQDVIDYFLNTPFPGLEEWQRLGAKEVCAHGLADAGRFDMFNLRSVPTGQGFVDDNLRFLAMTPAQRAASIQNIDMMDFDSFWDWTEIKLEHLEKELPKEHREEIVKKLLRKFEGGFGRIGPQESDYAQVAYLATAYRRLGFYRAAEAHLYIGATVDPFLFGTETSAQLDRDLLVPVRVQNRLAYAKLYREWGKPNRAYVAIGPLTEQAIARLASDTNPLPGTVEQWAKRFEPLFTAYLDLQFEGLTQGPNYPAIFAIQQYLQLANSTASASVLEQRLNSVSPDVARQYQDARRALRRAINTASEGDTKVAELSLQLQSIEAQLPKTDAALQSHQIGVTRSLRDVVLELRAAGSVMVVATQLPDAMVLMYLDGQGASARKLDLGRSAAEAQVAAFRRGVLGSNDTRDLFDVNQAASLYTALIGWGHVAKAAPDKLRLVMDGPFSTLPFAALRRTDGWLGAKAALRLSPSVARAASGLRKGRKFRGFVGLGDPNLTKGNVTQRTALLGAGFYLPELPETANELTFMALSFGGNPGKDVFTREEASESQMRQLNADNTLADVSILALATHGLLSRETGALNSAGLVLSLPTEPNVDGILTATEIYNYRIGADLVVLSACNTGTPGAGEGLSDLASAFLYSGAGALLLTHWEIDSGAGVEIMKRIAIDQRSAEATDYAASLQNALAGMLEDKGLEKYHHPRFWASHFILG